MLPEKCNPRSKTCMEDVRNIEIHTCAQQIEVISRIGFLPLLNSGIEGFSADEMVDEECRYVVFPDGGWDWPMWKWKGTVVTEGNCVYGKFFDKKAGFISMEWWPDFYNYRRSKHPVPEEGTIEDAVLVTLRAHGSLITRELRNACGFAGAKMRSKFDAYITRLQMGCHIVTEDFIYPRDRHNREYGWGWSLLTTPEDLYGREACLCPRTPEQSYQRIVSHLHSLLPHATATQINRLIS